MKLNHQKNKFKTNMETWFFFFSSSIIDLVSNVLQIDNFTFISWINVRTLSYWTEKLAGKHTRLETTIILLSWDLHHSFFIWSVEMTNKITIGCPESFGTFGWRKQILIWLGFVGMKFGGNFQKSQNQITITCARYFLNVELFWLFEVRWPWKNLHLPSCPNT